MCSVTAKESVVDCLVALFPHAEFGEELSRQWDLALDDLSDEQVTISLDYLRKRYGIERDENANFPPKPSQFLSWSRGAGTVLGGKGEQYFEYVAPETGTSQATVRVLTQPRQMPSARYVSIPERQRRMRSIAAVREGEKPSPLTLYEARKLLASNDPRDPEILAIRNKLRAGMGWPLLNEYGREVQ